MTRLREVLSCHPITRCFVSNEGTKTLSCRPSKYKDVQACLEFLSKVLLVVDGFVVGLPKFNTTQHLVGDRNIIV